MRAFCSAAIAKRHDTVTLDTSDGITITISGFINRSRTFENGFPSEVCNHFLFGFPYHWEEFAGRCFVEPSVNRAIPSRVSSLDGINMSSDHGTDNFPPLSLDDLPVTRVRDLLMSHPGDAGNYALSKSILNGILLKYGGNSYQHDGASVQSIIQSKCPGMSLDSVLDGNPSNRNKTMGKRMRKYDSGIHSLATGDSLHDGTPTKHNKTKIQPKSKNDDGILSAPDPRTGEFQKLIPESKMGVDVNSLSRGVTTRSMTRLNNLRNKQEKNLPPNTSVADSLNEPFSASKASGNQFRWMINRGNASSVSHAVILSDADIEAKETPDVSPIRKFSRLKSLIDPIFTSEASKNRYGGAVYRRNGSKVCFADIFSGEEMDCKQILDNSTVRRSNRLRKIIK